MTVSLLLPFTSPPTTHTLTTIPPPSATALSSSSSSSQSPPSSAKWPGTSATQASLPAAAAAERRDRQTLQATRTERSILMIRRLEGGRSLMIRWIVKKGCLMVETSDKLLLNDGNALSSVLVWLKKEQTGNQTSMWLSMPNQESRGRGKNNQHQQ